MTTARGIVKNTPISAYTNPRRGCIEETQTAHQREGSTNVLSP